MQKRCPKCDTKKDVSEFYENKARYDGLTSYCKTCDAEQSKTAGRRNAPSQRKKWGDSTAKRLHLRGSDY
jgi:hypothetical protein